MIRPILESERTQFDNLATHPLQSWQWGEFRRKTGLLVVRLGQFENDQLRHTFQMTIHKIPFTPFTVGYIPKSSLPDESVLKELRHLGKKYNLIYIKLEPNVEKIPDTSYELSAELTPAYRPLFTKYTFHLDLSQSEEQLLKNMHSKTRYNIRVAQKHGVTVQEENTEEAFTAYLALTHETTKRQGFYAHSNVYHHQMWETLRLPSTPLRTSHSEQALPIAHLFTARYQGKILTAWILFLFNNVLYYPYGASTSAHREVMASTLMMWETMRWGKMMGAHTYDLWGTPGPNPQPSDPYFGFHRFKMGFGPKLVEFIGSYDLVLKQPHYTIFKYIDQLRWGLLKLKARL